MNKSFENEYDELFDIIQKSLKGLIDSYINESLYIEKPIKYALFPGGKRIRAILFMYIYRMLSGDLEKAIIPACAIEIIHACSLVHDDLPCMDDDDFRRGKNTCHKEFGESTALLAGDALLNLTYEILFDYIITNNGDINVVKACKYIANAAGSSGMIDGQLLDLIGETKILNKEEHLKMNINKTGKVIQASIVAPAIIANASKDEILALKSYGHNLGIAFQIKDDILDVVGNEKILGKPIGSDEKKEKSSFISLYGIKGAKEMMNEYIDKAQKSIEIFNDRAEFLNEIALYCGRREK